MDNTKKTINVLSFCTGYGGFELALSRILSLPMRVVAVEIEAYAAANLAAKAEQNKLAIEALYTDVKTFPSRKFRGCFDAIVAGYPCQPFSNAGKRQGTNDPRHLWPFIRRHVAAVRPVFCIFENVAGHVTLGFDKVYQDLRALGYQVEAGLFTSAEVGAPHKRERLFILAYSKYFRCRGWAFQEPDGIQRQEFLQGEQEWNSLRCEASGCGGNELADSNSIGRVHGEFKEQSAKNGIDAQCDTSASSTKKLAYTVCSGGTENRQQCQLWTSCIGQPSSNQGSCPEEQETKRRWPARPGQFQYDWEEPRTVESGMGRTVDGFRSRVDELRLLGNGINPEQAEKAIRYLLKEIDNGKEIY